MLADVFSPSYAAARDRFRAAARALSLQVETIPVQARGPDGEALSLDVASNGLDGPALVLSSGLHGVEGYLGSAAQLAYLDALGRRLRAPRFRLVLLHALNPFGFAWDRRTDDANIDLNRNFLADGEPFRGSRTAFATARSGLARIRSEIAGGQYEHAAGLFYGGRAPAETRQILEAHLERWLGGAPRVLHVDFHTGLGRRATCRLFTDHARGSEEHAGLRAVFGDVVEPYGDEDGVGYPIRGALGAWCRDRFAPRSYDVLVAELGTYPAPLVLAALLAENRAWHADRRSAYRRLAARCLREAFAPRSRRWREETVRVALDVIQGAEALLEGSV